MLKLDPHLLTHKLKVKEGTKPVKQASKNYRPELKVQIKKVIQNLSDVSLIEPIQYPWLANTISAKKKNG